MIHPPRLYANFTSGGFCGMTFHIPIPLDLLLKMREAGQAFLIVDLENEETGEKTQTRIEISIEEINRMIAVMEAGERASRN